jgi:hypothetical protein
MTPEGAGPDATGTLRLDGVTLRVLFMTAPDASTLKDRAGFWASIFASAGARSWLFYEAAESATARLLFG